MSNLRSKNKKYIHLCISYSESFAELCSLCCSSIFHDKIIIHLNKFTEEIKYDKFRDKAWYIGVSSKIRFLYKIMNSLPEGSSVGLCDADTQTFKPDKIYDLKKIIDETDSEYIGIHEDPYERNKIVNTGFFVLKNNQNTNKMINCVAHENLSNYYLGDQDMINNYLIDNNIKYNLMPSVEFSVAPAPKLFNKNRIAFHHANYTTNVEGKKEQINHVRRMADIPLHQWTKEIIRHRNMIMYENGERV